MSNPTTRPGRTSPHDDITLLTALERFGTDEKARAFLEARRWPNGPYCPHCGNGDEARIHRIPENEAAKVRAGLLRCNECGKQFTVTVGTVMEDSHIPLHKWMIAFYRCATSKTLVSALQLQRELELGSYRSAWFMLHRIRFAMTDLDPSAGGTSKLGGTVEVDETWMGGAAKFAHGGRIPPKIPVVGLVQRDGKVRTEIIPHVDKTTLKAVLYKHVEKDAVLNTDESQNYVHVGREFTAHDTVNHTKKGEYSRKDKHTGRRASTNRIEGFFAFCKRSIDGTHHSIGPDYLSFYLGELVFKYNERDVSDGARTVAALGGVGGKRLTLRPAKKRSVAQQPAEPVAEEDGNDSEGAA